MKQLQQSIKTVMNQKTDDIYKDIDKMENGEIVELYLNLSFLCSLVLSGYGKKKGKKNG